MKTEFHFDGPLADHYFRALSQFDLEHANFRLFAKDAALFTNNHEAKMMDWLCLSSLLQSLWGKMV